MITVDVSKVSPRDPDDHYPTEERTIRQALALVQGTPGRVLDVGAGGGAWGRVARDLWPSSRLEGVELQACLQPPEYDAWHVGDIATIPLPAGFDLVTGNPPFGIADQVIARGLELLADGGEMVLLLPIRKLCNRGWLPLFRSLVEVKPCIPRPRFVGKGNSPWQDCGFFHWRRGFDGPPNVTW